MNKLRNAVFAIVACCTLSMTIACAKQQAKHSGFLENYPEFAPGREGGVDLVYLKEDVDFKKYYKVMLDHVVFYFKEDAEYKGIHPDKLNELSEAFHKSFVRALRPYFNVVDKPGPDVMRIRMAVTDIIPNKPALSAVTTVIPTALVYSFTQKAVTGSHTGVGQASMEAEILDSLTNERIGAVIDTRAGDKKDGLTEWGAVEAAFEFWGKKFRNWFDETHGVK